MESNISNVSTVDLCLNCGCMSIYKTERCFNCNNLFSETKDYYNTNNLKGSELKQAKEKAKSQQVLILETFKKYPDKELTPSEVFTMIDDYYTLLTSVRRAITNLEKAGKLIKTQNTKPGLYGSPNFCWKLK